jgi:hypothetical protein
VSAGVDAAVRADERAVADGNQAGVEDDEVVVEEDAAAEPDVGAVVDADGGFDPGVGFEEVGVGLRVGELGGEWVRVLKVVDAVWRREMGI